DCRCRGGRAVSKRSMPFVKTRNGGRVVDATVLPDVWADYPFTNSVPYPQWLDWRIGILREFVLAERATWPLTDEDRAERRLARYWTCPGSVDGELLSRSSLRPLRG